MAFLGIDFGTWQVRAAVVHGGSWSSPDEVVEVPAVFGFRDGRVTVGETVLLTAALMPDVIVRESKRMLGRTPGDPLLDRLAARYGLSVRAHGRNDLWLESRSEAGDPGVSLERALAALLEHVAETATGERGGHDVVFAVPAWFGDDQRDALLGAAERANLHVRRFVIDTLAAALWRGGDGKTIGVVDAGAGGVGAAAVRADRRRVTLLKSNAEPETGGEEIVHELATASGIAAEGADREVLRQACEQLAHDLALAREVSREVELTNRSARLSAAGWELDLLLAALSERVAHACAAAVGDLAVERFYALGGMMHHPAVLDAVTRRWGEPEVLPAAAPSVGAAMISASLAGTVELSIEDGEVRPTARSSSLPPGLGAPTSSKLSSPARSRPEVKRRRLSTQEMRVRRKSIGLTPLPRPTSSPPVSAHSSKRNAPSPPVDDPPASSAAGAVTLPAPGRAEAASPVSPWPTSSPPRVSSEPPASFGPSSRPGADEGLPWPSEGTVSPPTRPEEILSMPVTRPLTEADLDPVALPVLLRRILGRPGVRGLLRLEGPGILLQAPVAERALRLGKAELFILRKAFDAPRLRWRLDAYEEDDQPRDLHPLARLTLESLRRLLRNTDQRELEAALGPRIDEAPTLRDSPALVCRRLALDAREQRFVAHHMDGTTSARDLGRASGLAPRASLQLLALLALYDTLVWQNVEQVSGPSLSDELADRADRWERANHFDVLGVHWSTPDVEIAGAYERRAREYALGSESDQASPSVCSAIRRRIDRAYRVLRDPEQRVSYRNEIYRGVDFAAATEIARERSATLRLRGEAVEAKKSEIAAQELSQSARRQKSRDSSQPGKSFKP